MSQVSYASKRYPSFTVTLEAGKCKFQNHVFVTDDEAVIAELDKLIKRKPEVAMEVYKLDKDAAEKKLRAHLALKQPQATRGQTSTRNVNMERSLQELEQRDLSLAQQDAKVPQDKNYMLTEAAESQEVTDLEPPVDVKSETAEQEEKPAKPVSVFGAKAQV